MIVKVFLLYLIAFGSVSLATEKKLNCNFDKDKFLTTASLLGSNKKINKFLAYPCGHHNMLRYQLQCDGTYGKYSYFESDTFLNSLRNKQLGIMGDSITLQLYHALSNQLFDFQTMETKGNGTLSKDGFGTLYDAAFTHYGSYNATIFWCRVPTLHIDTSAKKENRDYCSDLLIRTSDYLVVGVAAWFKPFYSQDINDGTNFSHNSELSNQQFQNRIAASRAYIKLTNPFVKVLWRLQPHAGPIDELLYLHNITANHYDGYLWNNSSECASWVTRYNHMTVAVANRYGDKVMDWYYYPTNIWSILTHSIDPINCKCMLTRCIIAHKDFLVVQCCCCRWRLTRLWLNKNKILHKYRNTKLYLE